MIAPSVSQAQRIQKTACFIIDETVENVFPLFGPIREMNWAYGWNPHVVYSDTREVELHMIFQTHSSSDPQPFTWVVTQYRPDINFIEYTIFTTERVWTISVTCVGRYAQTEVSVTYCYTALTEAGHAKNERALEQMFASNLQDWRDAINHYLKTGEILKP